jgi:HAD superfamily hydrolase (TIGR01490 family)
VASIAAFFDLDGTLIAENSAMLWAEHEREHGNIARWQLVRAGLWSVLYRLSVIDIESAYAEATRHYRGQRFDDLQQRTAVWFQAEVEWRLRPQARSALADHRRAGHRLVLLTSSSCFEATAAAGAWGFDEWIANRFPTDAAGELDGTFAQPLCYGGGKVTLAEQWAARRQVDLDRCFFYSDSYSDLPMLERVGEPRVVAPDPRLRVAASLRGWPTLRW